MDRDIELAYEASRKGGDELTLEDALRYLNAARRVLDAIAEDEAGPDEAAAMAQRIVDVIGHSVTDEPPHLLVELDRLRDLLKEQA